MAGNKLVVSTMKDEAPYILEWVAYQKVIGFDDIVVYTNNCSDGTNRILSRLEELGHLTFRKNKVGAGGVHRSALRQARRLDVFKAAEWIFITDIDEFLNIHVGNHTVDDLIEASGGDEIDVISIPWRLYSYSHRNILRDSPVLDQFTDAEVPPEKGGAERRFVKSIFRGGDYFKRIGLHLPYPKPEYENKLTWVVPGGQQKQVEPFGGHVRPPHGSEVAQLNHYAVRSAQSYLLKRYRGRANHMGQTLGTEYWERWNRGGEEDTSIQRLMPQVQGYLDEFKADEQLAKLHRKGFKWHKNKLNELLKDPAYLKLYQQINKSEPIVCHHKDRD